MKDEVVLNNRVHIKWKKLVQNTEIITKFTVTFERVWEEGEGGEFNLESISIFCKTI